MQPSVTLNYELNLDDYVDFNVYHVAHTKTMMQSLILIRYGIPAFLLSVPFMLVRISSIPFWYWMSALIIVSLVHIWNYPKFADKVLRDKISKTLHEGQNKAILGNLTITISEDGILNVNQHAETKSTWDALERVVVTPEYIYIYIGSLAAYIVPCRAFADDKEKKRFTSALSSYATTTPDTTE